MRFDLDRKRDILYTTKASQNQIPARLFKGIRIIVLFAVVAGCRGDRAKEKNQLIYWPAANYQEIKLAERAAKRWNRLYPEMPVLIQPIPESQSTEEVLLAAVVGKTTPDICSNIWPGVVGQFVRANALIALDRFCDFDSVVHARMPAGQLQTYTYLDGHVYQMPWKTNPIMLEYNVNMLKNAGYTSPPSTYSEFIRMGQQLTKDLNGDGANDRWMMYVDINVKWWLRYFDFYAFYIAASNGNTLIRDRKIIFDNRAALEVFHFFQTGFRLGIFPKAGFQRDTFLSEEMATHITGPWNINHLNKFKPAGFEFDYAPVPVPDDHVGEVITYGDPKNMVIFSTTRYPEWCWKFLKFLITAEQDLALLQIASQIPIRKNLLSDDRFIEFFNQYPKLRRFAEQAPNTRGVDSDPELREIFDAISQEFEACCVLGRKSPEEAVSSAAERAREILR